MKVVVAAGDIAACHSDDDEATARLPSNIRGTVLTLGDNAYEDGTPEEFAECYDPSWGRYKARTKPTPGNHEYHTQGAEGYFDYFGDAAGDPRRGLLLLRPGQLAHGRPQQQLPRSRWLRRCLALSPLA